MLPSTSPQRHNAAETDPPLDPELHRYAEGYPRDGLVTVEIDWVSGLVAGAPEPNPGWTPDCMLRGKGEIPILLEDVLDVPIRRGYPLDMPCWGSLVGQISFHLAFIRSMGIERIERVNYEDRVILNELGQTHLMSLLDELSTVRGDDLFCIPPTLAEAIRGRVCTLRPHPLLRAMFPSKFAFSGVPSVLVRRDRRAFLDPFNIDSELSRALTDELRGACRDDACWPYVDRELSRHAPYEPISQHHLLRATRPVSAIARLARPLPEGWQEALPKPSATRPVSRGEPVHT